MKDLAVFRQLVKRSLVAAYGDSNDREIELLQAVRSEACGLLGIEEWALREEAEQEAERRGYF